MSEWIARRRLAESRERAAMPHLGKPPKIHLWRQNIPVLSVSPVPDDHGALEALLPKPQWTVYRADSLNSALSLLRHVEPTPLVVCERDLLQTTWQDLLIAIMSLPDRPFFIVTSRLADEYLWAEALNLGAYDVLAKPFDVTELTRSLSLAWQHSRPSPKIMRRLSTAANVAIA
jgi:DNA-binding NtrC family response regulator